MRKAQEFISNIKDDRSFVCNNLSLGYNLDYVRKNPNVSKLTLLVRNSDSALDCCVQAINEIKLSSENDLRVFALLTAVFDARRIKESILLSMDLQHVVYLAHSSLLSTNILLKESIDG